MYALGAITYELITGTRPPPPLDGERTPPASTVAQDHSRSVPFDLDAILSRALAIEPADRYRNAGAFKDDLERFLRHEPVKTLAGNRLYWLRRQARRHWRPLALAAAALIATGYGFWQVNEARNEAERQSERAESVADFLKGIFAGANPQDSYTAERLDTLSARGLLNLGTVRIGTELEDQPLLQADLLATVGDVYHDLGLFEIADSLHSRSADLYRAASAPDSDVVYALEDVAMARQQLGRYDEADSLFRVVLAVRERVRGEEGGELALANAHNNLAYNLIEMGEIEEARSYFEQAYAVYQAASDAIPEDLAMMTHNLGEYYRMVGDNEQAEVFIKEAMTQRAEVIGTDHADYAATLGTLGVLYMSQRRYDESIPLLREAVRVDSAALGGDHLYVAMDLDNLGRALCSADRCDEAVPLHERAVRIKESSVGPDHPTTARGYAFLGDALRESERYYEAQQALEQALQIQLASTGESHPGTGVAYLALARLDRDRGRLLQASDRFRRAVEIRENAYGSDHALVGSTYLEWAKALAEGGDPETAKPLARRAEDVLSSVVPDSTDTRRQDARALLRRLGLR